MRSALFILALLSYINISTAAPLPEVSAREFREYASTHSLRLRSSVVLITDEDAQEPLFAQNADQIVPIASLTKLMTAMVVLDSALPLDEVITIDKQDKDRIRYSRSRLRAGMKFTRKDLLFITLSASENRAAMALGRTHPGGMEEFIKAMNDKARALGLEHTRFADPAGLRDANQSTAMDLVALTRASSNYPLIQHLTTEPSGEIMDLATNNPVIFRNTNRFVKADSWPVMLSKTGFTSTAGNCLIMQTEINQRQVIIVLLESWGKQSKYGDSNRIKNWIVKSEKRIAEQHKKNDITKVETTF